LIGRITIWDADQLGLPTVPSHDPKDPNNASANPYSGIRRFRHKHERVQRFAVGPSRADDVAVVGRVRERSRQSTVEPDLTLVVDLVDISAAARRLNDHVDKFVHAPQLTGAGATALRQQQRLGIDADGSARDPSTPGRPSKKAGADWT
jgi:hypothetical protein